MDLEEFMDRVFEDRDPEEVISLILSTIEESGLGAARNLDLRDSQTATDRIVQEVVCRRVEDDYIQAQMPLVMPDEDLGIDGRIRYGVREKEDSLELRRLRLTFVDINPDGSSKIGNAILEEFEFPKGDLEDVLVPLVRAKRTLPNDIGQDC